MEGRVCLKHLCTYFILKIDARNKLRRVERQNCAKTF